MKKKAVIWVIIGCVICLFIFGYFGVAYYFSKHFYPDTTINKIDVSGKSLLDATKQFEKVIETYELTIGDEGVEEESIYGKNIHLKYASNKEIQEVLKQQNVWSWIADIFQKKTKTVKFNVEYDETLLDEQINQLKILKEEQIPGENAKPVFNGEQFVIQKETNGTGIDYEKIKKALEKKIQAQDMNLNLEKEQCYLAPEYTEKSEKVRAACDIMNSYLEASITYDMTEPVIVDRSLIGTWITVDQDMEVVFQTDLIKVWLEEFGNKNDTVGITRTFTTPDGRAAQVSGGTYGWSIDEETELTNLQNDIKNKAIVTRQPAYYIGGIAATHAMPDWGNTYIDVDLTAQHMWYVVNGTVELSTDIVSGEPIPEKITPEGVYTILEKEADSTLVGETNPTTGQPKYIQPVRFWMRVTWSGIGFHDADWQSAFGGTLNQISGTGSHGCINMPVDQAQLLFSKVEVGTPVIIHY